MSEVRISVSKASIGDFDPAHHNHFKTKSGEFMDLVRVICSSTWSPITWIDGYRVRKNFESASLIALDFDSGVWTLDHAKNFFSDYGMNFILAITKSHQKEKTTSTGKIQPPCDRFRVLIESDGPCTVREDYEYTMQKLMEKIPCDKSCKDGARYFFPCKELIATGQGGNLFSFEKKPESVKQIESKLKEFRNRDITHHRNNGTIPWAIKKLLTEGATEGKSRHQSCYRIGAELSKIGYGESEIVTCILNQKSNLKEIGVSDVERAVRNGIQAAR